MRVLVIPGYYGFGGFTQTGAGGAGVFFRDQTIALARSGHDASLMYVHFDAESGAYVDVRDEDGVRCIYIHAAPWPRLNSVHRILLMSRAFSRVFRDARPEVIHAHIFHALPAAWALSRAFGIPYVVTEHSSKVRQRSLRWGWRMVARFGYDRASAVIAVSQPLAEALARYTRREVVVVPNVVRDEFFSAPLTEQSEGAPFTFLSVGYCDSIKGWDILLRAFAEMGFEGRATRLVLCGARCPELEELAHNLGLGERVRFVGRVSPEAVPAMMAACDCHVMPSRVETFGIASVEALACGKPIIMTDTDAASAIIHPEVGVSVPVGDVGALSRAMRSMTQNVGRFVPSAVREDCRERFSGDAVISRLVEIYPGGAPDRARAWRAARNPLGVARLPAGVRLLRRPVGKRSRPRKD